METKKNKLVHGKEEWYGRTLAMDRLLGAMADKPSGIALFLQKFKYSHKLITVVVCSIRQQVVSRRRTCGLLESTNTGDDEAAPVSSSGAERTSQVKR
jgi:hypothetical protein